MKLTVKHISRTHAELWDGETWIATVNIKDAPERAEAVRKAIEEDAAKSGAIGN